MARSVRARRNNLESVLSTPLVFAANWQLFFQCCLKLILCHPLDDDGDPLWGLGWSNDRPLMLLHAHYGAHGGLLLLPHMVGA